MAWGDIPTYQHLDGYIDYARSELGYTEETNIIKACEKCWSELENSAIDRLTTPDSRNHSLTVHDSVYIVDATKDDPNKNAEELEKLFDSEIEEFYLSDENHEPAKKLIGSMVLKDGDYQEEDDESLTEYIRSLLTTN